MQVSSLKYHRLRIVSLVHPVFTMVFFLFSFGVGHDNGKPCKDGINIMSTVLPDGKGALKWSSCSKDVLQTVLR